MRVLHVINSLGMGGAEKLIVDTLPLYRANEITVDLLLLNGTKTDFYEELKQTVDIKIHDLGLSSLFNPVMIFRIIPYLNKYDLIHVHLFPALYWVSLAKFFSRSKTKLVFTKHSTSNRRMEASLFTRNIERWIFSRYSAIISISPEVEARIKSLLRFPLDRFALIDNGVDLSVIKLASPFREKIFEENREDIKVVIQVSSFRMPKDQPTLLRALALLPIEVKLLLVGDGPQRSTCEKMAEELGIKDRVKFLGVRMDVPQLLKAADIVVLSTGFEGLSLAVVEGMAAGRPVVGSDVPGVRGVIKGAGVFFPKGDEAALAKVIKALLNDSDYYKCVANSCLERAKLYDVRTMVRRHLDLYNKVVSHS